MSGVTCGACGATLSAPAVECSSCHATLPPASIADGSAGSAPTIAEPPPSDVSPVEEGSTGSERAAQDGQGTITEGPAGTDTPREESGAATLRTPEAVRPSGPTVAVPHSRPRASSASGRSGLLQSGTRGDGTEGELFDEGKYEILKEIARGGMGAVYKARQRDLNRVVALKVMLAGAMASEGEKKRFLREAEASAKLKHPNIVPVYDIGEVDGNLYFTMDFVEGAPLSEKKTELDRARLLDVMIKVADAVSYAHMRGIIHRDLKPANVMMDRRGEPLIMDFGLAKETSAESDSGSPDLRTREGQIMGTPHYMPPEQAEGLVSEIDVRSDVYALGVILYELWTGRLPFVAKRVSDLMRMVISEEPPALRAIDPSVPWEIEAIALRAMEKQKAKRYENALDMKRDLERFKNGEAVLARNASVLYRARKWARRNRVYLGVFLGAVGLGALYHRQANRQWYAALSEARVKIEETASTIAVTSRAVAGIPAALEGARSVPDSSKRAKALDDLLRQAKKASTDIASARGSLHFTKDVERELHEAMKAPEKDASDLAALLEKWQEGIVAAEAERLREANARDLIAAARADLIAKRFADARSKCLAAAELGVKEKDLLATIGQAEQLAAREKQSERAKAALAEGSLALEAAAREDDLDKKLEGAQDALSKLADGLGQGDTDARPALEGRADDARDLYARALMGKRYYALARLALKPLLAKDARAEAAKRARDLDAEIKKKEEAAEFAVARLDVAQDSLRTGDAEGALATLRDDVARRFDVLSPADQERFRRLEVEALSKALSSQTDLAVAESKWALAEKEVDTLEAELAKRSEGAPAMVAPLRKDVKRAHAEFRVAAAKRLQEANVPRALELVLAAIPDLPASSPTLLDARTLRADLELRRDKPLDMERIPEAQVQLGGADETNPAHAAAIRSFYLGRHEVTNREFAKFVAAGGYGDATLWETGLDRTRLTDASGKPGPKGWRDGKPREGTEDEPVTGVSFHEADAYARWLARTKSLPFRLPTDDEWEAAARLASAKPGTTQVQTFPWGEEWGAPGARLARAAEERRGPSPVREDAAHPEDRSACHCYDMAGNVAEWVASADPARGSVRGGSFLLPFAEACAPAHRSTPRRTLRSEGVGFRVALDAARKEGDK